MSRRRLLVVLAVTGIAGCAGGDQSGYPCPDAYATVCERVVSSVHPRTQ